MDPFDWTKDKAIYQRWQLWSEKARLTPDAMEGDSSVDEITAKLQGMTVFTIVDFKTGYWMVVLHPDSRKLTCMALPFGRFQ